MNTRIQHTKVEIRFPPHEPDVRWRDFLIGDWFTTRDNELRIKVSTDRYILFPCKTSYHRDNLFDSKLRLIEHVRIEEVGG